MRVRTRLAGLLLSVAAVPAIAGAAEVAIAPETRVVGDGAHAAVRLHGEAAGAFELRVNGRPVTPRGGRHWRADVPVERLRAWSAPFARDMLVTIRRADAAGGDVTQERLVRLPTGLLGRDPDRAIRLSAR